MGHNRNDGHNPMLDTLMRLHEKMAWMLRSYIEPELAQHEKQVASFHPPLNLENSS